MPKLSSIVMAAPQASGSRPWLQKEPVTDVEELTLYTQVLEACIQIAKIPTQIRDAVGRQLIDELDHENHIHKYQLLKTCVFSKPKIQGVKKLFKINAHYAKRFLTLVHFNIVRFRYQRPYLHDIRFPDSQTFDNAQENVEVLVQAPFSLKSVNIQIDYNIASSLCHPYSLTGPEILESLQEYVKSVDVLIYACMHSGKSTFIRNFSPQLFLDTDCLPAWFLTRRTSGVVITNMPHLIKRARNSIAILPTEAVFKERMQLRSVAYKKSYYKDLIRATKFASVVVKTNKYLTELDVLKNVFKPAIGSKRKLSHEDMTDPRCVVRRKQQK